MTQNNFSCQNLFFLCILGIARFSRNNFIFYKELAKKASYENHQFMKALVSVLNLR